MIRPTYHRSEGSPEWYTPKYILDALGEFDTDPCSPLVRPFDTAKAHYTKADNGLCQPWIGRVWLNPPYGDLKPWMRNMGWHGNGIALVFARLDAKWFREFAMSVCTGLLFLPGRVKFFGPDGKTGNAPAPSVLVAYDPPGQKMNCLTLARCGLPGEYVDRWLLRQPKPLDPLDLLNLDRGRRALTNVLEDYK